MIFALILFLIATPFGASLCGWLWAKTYGKPVSNAILTIAVFTWPIMLATYLIALIAFHVFSVFVRLFNRWSNFLNTKL
ncbi:hypothetical protein CPT_Muldoon_081 [Serratia phage Muldoon]|uniref:Uncharacterized protein n=1 Tax=Serratia phage Muldoon TaxID=2601678 RepID=A0A5P8PH73_9CAUD|nr:hypothetical protein HYP94_gp080 [Serratia phage Muldoon]QFR56036.1 hypothetical protein CPT_Muldoon_081 [Serratia phage Muldoon]WDS61626.1 hypothetical protein [Cronobacter phage vB_Cdu_VP8]